MFPGSRRSLMFSCACTAADSNADRMQTFLAVGSQSREYTQSLAGIERSRTSEGTVHCRVHVLVEIESSGSSAVCISNASC